MDIRFSYMAYSLLFLAVWAGLFIARADLRRPMLIFGILVAPLGPASEYWYLRDYWKRETITGTGAGVEDVLFSFAIGGIPLALYPIASRTRLTSPVHAGLGPRVVGIFAGSTLLSLLLGTGVFHFNSIFTTVLAVLVTIAYIIFKRPDLLKPAVVSGGLTLLLFVSVYELPSLIFPGVLESWCAGCNPTGLRFWGNNVEELLWDLTWGMLAGVLYQAAAGPALAARIIGAQNENRPST